LNESAAYCTGGIAGIVVIRAGEIDSLASQIVDIPKYDHDALVEATSDPGRSYALTFA
jgi:hypothetical protein